MTDLEELPDDDYSAHAGSLPHFTDEERRALTNRLVVDHLFEIERRVRAIRSLLDITN